jgi:flavin-dependent dehydrogenase
MVRVLVEPDLEHYLTPVGPDELQVAVLGTSRAFAAARISPARFVDHLREHPHLGPRLRGAEPTDKPLGAGPFRQRARAVAIDGALLVGDAAGYVDAITGEGVGLALQTGRAAGDAIGAELVRGSATPLVGARAIGAYTRAHRQIVRDAERLTQVVLLLARFPWLARRAVSALAASPLLFEKLLRVQAGAPLASVGMSGWVRLAAG